MQTETPYILLLLSIYKTIIKIIYYCIIIVTATRYLFGFIVLRRCWTHAVRRIKRIRRAPQRRRAVSVFNTLDTAEGLLAIVLPDRLIYNSGGKIKPARCACLSFYNILTRI